MSFLARCRLFQVVSGRFFFGVGRFKSFLARSRLFQVVSGRFLLFVGRFRSFQVVSYFAIPAIAKRS